MRPLTTIVFLITILLITSCDAPRNRRLAYDDKPAYGGGDDQDGGKKDDDDDGGGGGSPNSDIPSDTNCSFSTNGSSGYESYSNYLGPYTLCKSSKNPKTFYLQIKNPISSVMLCVIPTTTQGGGSTYIGMPQCRYFDSSTKVESISMIFDRNGFENSPATGAMLIKEEAVYLPSPYPTEKTLLPDAYLFCMQILYRYDDPSYCNTFKSFGAYHYHRF